jgi:hypothetical protein
MAGIHYHGNCVEATLPFPPGVAWRVAKVKGQVKFLLDLDRIFGGGASLISSGRMG